MRIIAGHKRGLKLAEVGKGDVSAHLRPTSDRVRESLFNVLHHQQIIPGARVLDLFAGTGALGFEALSRGASHVTFVDDGQAARALLRENTGLFKAGGAVKVFHRDATKLGDLQGEPFNLVFMDPPYGKELGKRALESAQLGGWLLPGAIIVWEENTPQLASKNFKRLDTRKYGDTHITILEYSA